MEHKERKIDIFFEDNDRDYTFVTPVEEVDAEDFKDDIHYYLTQSTLENAKIMLIKERYGEFVVMPKAKFSKEIFDAFMCGLDETLANSGFARIKEKFLKNKKEEQE